MRRFTSPRSLSHRKRSRKGARPPEERQHGLLLRPRRFRIDVFLGISSLSELAAGRTWPNQGLEGKMSSRNWHFPAVLVQKWAANTLTSPLLWFKRMVSKLANKGQRILISLYKAHSTPIFQGILHTIRPKRKLSNRFYGYMIRMNTYDKDF